MGRHATTCLRTLSSPPKKMQDVLPSKGIQVFFFGGGGGGVLEQIVDQGPRLVKTNRTLVSAEDLVGARAGGHKLMGSRARFRADACCLHSQRAETPSIKESIVCTIKSYEGSLCTV